MRTQDAGTRPHFLDRASLALDQADPLGDEDRLAGRVVCKDILAANHLGQAFYAPAFKSPGPANMARFTYLDPVQ